MKFEQKMLDAVRAAAVPLAGAAADYDKLLDAVGDAQIVLLGEATHGTQEFYDIRATLSKRLITEKNFNAIAIEGDWPDAYQINQYTMGQDYKTAADALASFDRFPTWMWRNEPIIQLAEWLKEYNGKQPHGSQINFYGLDLYSLYRSIDAIIEYLKKINPEAALEAQYHYSCFENYRHEPQAYGYAVASRFIVSCEGEVVAMLRRLQQQDWDKLAQGKLSADDAFYIAQNARVVKNAEAYYRSLFVSEVNNWNLRDSHMMQTLQEIIKHYQLKGVATPKIIIWAHNSHLGNAAATQMAAHGEYNIGQLIKEQFGKRAVSVGFTTYTGTVSAASNWHEQVERKQVREALPESYEAFFHATQVPQFLLQLNGSLVPERLLERAIGVVYHPSTERASHYFYADLARQFDWVIHCDTTHALVPLDKTAQWLQGEVPETYPSGF